MRKFGNFLIKFFCIKIFGFIIFLNNLKKKKWILKRLKKIFISIKIKFVFFIHRQKINLIQDEKFFNKVKFI